MNITELKQHWEAWRKSRKVALNSKLIEGIDALLADHESLAKQNAAMREACEFALSMLCDAGNAKHYDPSWTRPMRLSVSEVQSCAIQAYHVLHNALSPDAGRDYVSKEFPTSPTWPIVLEFAHRMESKLAKNRHKGDREGWLKDDPWSLVERILDETVEVQQCFTVGSDGRIDFKDAEALANECADVANFCMMVADCAIVTDQPHRKD